MKNILTYIAVIILTPAIAQEFSPGYYIIQPSAKYSIINPSYSDFDLDANNAIHYPDMNTIEMRSGEVVIAFEYSGGKVYCFDINGRGLVIDALTSLTKAPIVPGAGVGLMTETIALIDGSSLDAGSYYWIIGQDISKSTIKIQINDGIVYEIPFSKIQLYSALLKKYAKTEVMKTVQ